MVLEEQRYLHEDIERLEQALADRYVDEPRQDRQRLNRDHEMSQILDSLHSQAKALLSIYDTRQEDRLKEIQSISLDDSFGAFQKQAGEIREYHRRNPNQLAENLETAYKKSAGGEVPLIINGMFTGEEFYGRYFDMYGLHEQFLNLPSQKQGRRVAYTKYLETFDDFSNFHKKDKLSDEYLLYLRSLVEYLEGFMRKTRPLENLDKLFAQFEVEFEKAWEEGKAVGWEQAATIVQNDSPTWCQDCDKEYCNDNVFKHHFTSKKHIKNAERRKQENGFSNNTTNGTSSHNSVARLKEKVIAEREFRVKKLAQAMQTQRSDTRDNVERKAAMTERERAQELEAMNEDRMEMIAQAQANGDGDDGSDDEEEKIYNPLKLPLDWTGKPIPFWLYKLHGLGVEFECEICGNFTYMGRRAFDKHFNESRHVYGLKCLGITSSPLFRDITRIEEAQNLWRKVQGGKREEKNKTDGVVQMEDGEGNVMPEKVYYDLQKQGLI